MNAVDMKGKVFDRLKVLRQSERRDSKGRVFWVCECECGNVVTVRGDNLRSGNSKQCMLCARDNIGTFKENNVDDTV